MLPQFALIAFGALLSVSVAWLVGNTLAARLEREKKVAERDAAALTGFQDAYGEFFAVWKQWGNCDKDVESRDRLLAEAAAVEGRFEALLVMVCSERPLSRTDIEALGALRQGFQQLRNAIKTGRDLDWWSSADLPYQAFKALTAHVSTLLRPRVMGWAGRGPRRPTASEAAHALLAATADEFEVSWVGVGETLIPHDQQRNELGPGHRSRGGRFDRDLDAQ